MSGTGMSMSAILFIVVAIVVAVTTIGFMMGTYTSFRSTGHGVTGLVTSVTTVKLGQTPYTLVKVDLVNHEGVAVRIVNISIDGVNVWDSKNGVVNGNLTVFFGTANVTKGGGESNVIDDGTEMTIELYMDQLNSKFAVGSHTITFELKLPNGDVVTVNVPYTA